MRKICFALAICGGLLCGQATAQSPTIRYNFRINPPAAPRNPQPRGGFYDRFAEAATRYNSAAMSRLPAPVDTVWEQAQGINPEWIINPFAELDAQTLRLIASPFRNCPIQRAGDAPRFIVIPAE